MMVTSTRKEQIAKQFSKHAHHYDDVAQIQSDIGFDALQQVIVKGRRAIDIGSGTGRLTALLLNQFENVKGVDLSPGMVTFAQHKYEQLSHLQFLQGDAENLPIQSESVDFVFSCMTLQWCNPIAKSLAEVYRVLEPGGQAMLVIMCKDSMHELRSAWGEIDSHPRVNQFAGAEDLIHEAQLAGFTVISEQKRYVSWHSDIHHLLNSIRHVGASVVSNSKIGQPLTRQTLLQLESVYSKNFAQQGQLPLTYDLAYLRLSKNR